jgi:hypothetical protein
MPESIRHWPTTQQENLMNSGVIKSLVICTLGTALIAGCASFQSSPSVASDQSSAQLGKVAAVETVAVIDQSTLETSSGSSATVTTVSGGPDIVTVLFSDGTEGRYAIKEQAAPFQIGQPVAVVKSGDGFTMLSPQE